MQRPTSISWQISQSAKVLAMVEILLSLVLLIAAIALAFWPYAVIHDHTIDGLFLTLTGSMLTLLFLLNFIWQLRFQGAKEGAAIRHAWLRLTRTLSAVFSKGDTDMRTIPPRVSIPLVMGTLLLLILAFPSSLYANDIAVSQQSLIAVHSQALTAVLPNQTVIESILGNGRHRDRGLLMDPDFRLRAAAALLGNPAVEKPAENARVPLRMIVITASPLLEV
jgi:hypothetical protein